MNIILIYFAIKYKGDWNKIYEALENKEKPSLEDLKKIEKDLEDKNYKVITIIDQEYPSSLKQAYKPPFVIWTKGNIKLLNKPVYCLTGDTRVDEITTQRIIEGLNSFNDNHLILIPGFKGTDVIIKENSRNPIVSVLAEGVNQKNKSDIVITEYPPNISHPIKEHFKSRNRIIAALSKELVLFSSKIDGGVNHMVSSFLNLGKEINCFPGKGDKTDGNSELIKQGARLITNIGEIL